MDGAAGAAVRFGILGPLGVEVAGRAVGLGGPRQRSVLALLLLNANQVVSVSRIMDALWADDPPPAAESTLRGYVSHLRKALTQPELLVTRPSGYQLTIAAEQLDAARFERLSVQGRRALREGAAPEAGRLLREALELWRGPALADLAHEAWARAHCAHLDELRRLVIEARIEADLALGRHAELIGELELLVAQYPLRERLHGHRMLALYRSGRQAEALAAYRSAFELLAGENGLEPSTGLRELQQAILRQAPALDWAAAAGPVAPAARGETARPGASEAEPGAAVLEPVAAAPRAPAELPPDIAAFTGRAAVLAELDALLAHEHSGPATNAVRIAAIAGAAGAGKTALAVHWGHRVRARFPDGQLYVNLRGYSAGTPVRPIEALGRLLRSLGVEPAQVPEDVDEAAGRYRSLLADRRVLVVLDNAANSDQVRSLLPASGGCVAVVTSRDRLTALIAEGATPFPLDLLTPFEAREMLIRRLGRDRLAQEPQAAEQIAVRCARLPLALALVAARAATQPQFSLAVLADELGDARRGLDSFSGDGTGTDVRAVFSWSLDTLSPVAARLFRLLGLHSGPEISTLAAASLTGLAPREAAAALSELARAHLVQEQAPGRWAFHDLLRAYAAERAEADEPAQDRRAAVRRLLDHCLQTAETAALLINPHRDGIQVEPVDVPGELAPLPDARAAMAWFTDEHSNLLAGLAQAAEAGLDSHVWRLAHALWDYLDRRGHWHDWAVANHAALAASERLGDARAQALAHRGLGRAAARLHHAEDAHAHYEQALALFRRVGDAGGQARSHLSLGSIGESGGRYREALRHCEQALALFTEAGNRPGQARALNAVGWMHAQLGDHGATLEVCRRALELQRELGDRRGEAATADSLGYAHHHEGRHVEAIECYQHSLALLRELDDRAIQGEVLVHLGDAQAAAGDPAAASDSWTEAIAILDRLGDHRSVAAVRAKIWHLRQPRAASGAPLTALRADRWISGRGPRGASSRRRRRRLPAARGP